MINFGMGPKKGPDGKLAITLPMGDKKLPGIGADDMGNMFQFKRDFEEDYTGVRNIEVSRSINSSLQTFDSWLSKNKDRIPLE